MCVSLVLISPDLSEGKRVIHILETGGAVWQTGPFGEGPGQPGGGGAQDRSSGRKGGGGVGRVNRFEVD